LFCAILLDYPLAALCLQNSGFRLLVCERYDWPKSMIIPATIYDHGPGTPLIKSIDVVILIKLLFQR
jgi:hypothetical protein